MLAMCGFLLLCRRCRSFEVVLLPRDAGEPLSLRATNPFTHPRTPSVSFRIKQKHSPPAPRALPPRQPPGSRCLTLFTFLPSRLVVETLLALAPLPLLPVLLRGGRDFCVMAHSLLGVFAVCSCCLRAGLLSATAAVVDGMEWFDSAR